MRSYEKWQNISQRMCQLADFLKTFFSVSRAMIKTLFGDAVLWKEQTKHISKWTHFLKQGENVENNKNVLIQQANLWNCNA